MRRIFFASALFAIALVGCDGRDVQYSLSEEATNTLHARHVKQVQVFRSVHVGMEMPGFTASSMKDVRMTPTTPEGNFFIYVLQSDLPPACFDEECGEAFTPVSDKGGHVFGFSDGKAASIFGIKIQSVRPYAFDETLVVVTNRSGTIVALFESAKITDVPLITEGIQ